MRLTVSTSGSVASQITKPAAIHADFRVEFAADPLAPTGEKMADSEKVSPSAGQLVPG